MILVLKSKLDVDTNLSDEIVRPLLILLGKKGGGFSLYARNVSVFLCRNCGGMFGDPFEGITIKGQVFFVRVLWWQPLPLEPDHDV